MKLARPHSAAKLRVEDILWIRGLRGRVRTRTIAAIFGISSSTVSEIQRGASWRWLAPSGEADPLDDDVERH